MIYRIILSPTADEGIKALRKNEPQAYKKAMQLIQELQEHPTTGTGKPEPLKGNRSCIVLKFFYE
jgi:toxin YoeB